jgi:hypothetical protein
VKLGETQKGTESDVSIQGHRDVTFVETRQSKLDPSNYPAITKLCPIDRARKQTEDSKQPGLRRDVNVLPDGAVEPHSHHVLRGNREGTERGNDADDCSGQDRPRPQPRAQVHRDRR